MALNRNRANRSKDSASMKGGIYRLKNGKNTIRVFSFPHKVTKQDFEKGIYLKSDNVKVGETYDEVEREVLRHYTGDGVVNCPLVNCEHCAKSKELLESNKKADKLAGQKLKASKGFYINIVDMNQIPYSVQICSVPSTVFNEIISTILDPEFGEEVLGPDGRDFLITRDSDESPQRMYTVRLRDKDKCEELPESLCNDVTDLFNLKILEPGYSSDDELNKYFDEKAENDEEKIERRRSLRRGKKENENPYEDEQSDIKAPWEKDEFGIGDIVSFNDDGEDFSGKIIELEENIAAVQTGTTDEDIFDIPINELTLIEKEEPKQKQSNRRRRK